MCASLQIMGRVTSLSVLTDYSNKITSIFRYITGLSITSIRNRKFDRYKIIKDRYLRLYKYTQGRTLCKQLFSLIQPSNSTFINLRIFFFKQTYARLYNNLDSSFTIFYYFMQYNMFNKNIFKHAMDTFKNMVRPFFFTDERRTISSNNFIPVSDYLSGNNSAHKHLTHVNKTFFLANLATGFEYIARIPTRLIKLNGHYLPM